jgi:aspartate/methionine/tyrosine aminotransferase
VLLRPGEVAAVEEPGYPPVANLLRTLGVQVAGVPVDEPASSSMRCPGTRDWSTSRRRTNTRSGWC